MIKKIKNWVLSLFSSRTPLVDENAQLKARIKEAKETVSYTTFGNFKFVTNYDEVREILHYEDTLGMALFVREYIANSSVSIEDCFNYLTRNDDKEN